MERFKKILKAILFLRPIPLTIAVLLGFGSMGVSLLLFGGEHIITYISYGLSAYALTVLSCGMPMIVGGFKSFKDNNALLSRFFSDKSFRTKVALITSVVINLAYTALQFGLGIWHGSAWYYSFGTYYLLLSVMRGFLLRELPIVEGGNDKRKEWLLYRLVGATLIPLNLALFGISLFITKFGYGAKHHYITTIALAAYTFYAFTMAIISIVKERRLGSPLMAANRIVGLVNAAVSMLTLETAMFYSFAEPGNEGLTVLFTSVTSGVICAFTLGLGIYMLIIVNKNLRKIKESEINEQRNAE